MKSLIGALHDSSSIPDSRTSIPRGMCRLFLPLIGLVVFLAAGCAFGGSKNAYAYISYDDGTIEQYKVKADGSFVPLSPAKASAAPYGRWLLQLRVDPSARFAFAPCAENRTFVQFKIGNNGELELMKDSAVRTPHKVQDIAYDHTGQFLYVSNNSNEQGVVLQYRINADRTLTPLNPPSVNAGLAPGRIAVHPTKSFLYVANVRGGGMSQYKIRKDGTLSPIGLDPRVQSNLAWGEEYGYLAFTKDGRYLYATTGMSQSLDQFEVNNDGTLSLLSTSEYGWEFDMCCGLAHVVLDPSDQVLLTINQTARSSIVFTLNGSHRPISSPSQYNKLTRDNKRFVSLEELRKSVKENLPKVTYKDKTPTSAELCAEINAEIAAVDALIAVPITAEYGPKDTLYVVSTSEVARFKLMPDGSTKGEPSALDWPDLRKRKKADNTAGTESAADDRFPTGLTFLYR